MRRTEASIINEIMSLERGKHISEDTAGTCTDGGYSNDPRDPGGETNWGVTEHTLRRLGYTIKPKELMYAQACEIYHTHYFVACGAGRVMPYHPWLAYAMTNIAINGGSKLASTTLQKLLNLHNNQGQYWMDLIVDGDIGNKTMLALGAYLRRRALDGEKIIYLDYVIAIGAHYQAVVTKRERSEAFMYGWSRRAAKMLTDYLNAEALHAKQSSHNYI